MICPVTQNIIINVVVGMSRSCLVSVSIYIPVVFISYVKGNVIDTGAKMESLVVPGSGFFDSSLYSFFYINICIMESVFLSSKFNPVQLDGFLPRTFKHTFYISRMCLYTYTV